MTDIKRGFWMTDKGERVFVVGRDCDSRYWVTRLSCGLFSFVSCGGTALHGDWRLTEFLEGCDSWDWKPKRSLGERLFSASDVAQREAFGSGKPRWQAISQSEQVANQAAAEAFLRDVLTPPVGKTLGRMFADAYGCGRSIDEPTWEETARKFIESLTELTL